MEKSNTERAVFANKQKPAATVCQRRDSSKNIRRPKGAAGV